MTSKIYICLNNKEIVEVALKECASL